MKKLLRSVFVATALCASVGWGAEAESSIPLTILGADLKADCVVVAGVGGILEDSGEMQLVELTDVHPLRCDVPVTRAIVPSDSIGALTHSSERILLFLRHYLGETGHAVAAPLPPTFTELQVAALSRIWDEKWTDMIESGESLNMAAALDHFERRSEMAEAEIWNAASIADTETERFWVARAAAKCLPENEMRGLADYLLEFSEGYWGAYSSLQLSVTPAETRIEVLSLAMQSRSPMRRQAAYRLSQEFVDILPSLESTLLSSSLVESDQSAAFELARASRLGRSLKAIENLISRQSSRELILELAIGLAQAQTETSLSELETLSTERPDVKEVLYQALGALVREEGSLGTAARAGLLAQPLEQDPTLRYAQVLAWMNAPSGAAKIKLLTEAAFDESDAQFPSATRAIEALMMDCSSTADGKLSELATSSPRERHRSLIRRVLSAWQDQGVRQCN